MANKLWQRKWVTTLVFHNSCLLVWALQYYVIQFFCLQQSALTQYFNHKWKDYSSEGKTPTVYAMHEESYLTLPWGHTWHAGCFQSAHHIAKKFYRWCVSTMQGTFTFCQKFAITLKPHKNTRLLWRVRMVSVLLHPWGVVGQSIKIKIQWGSPYLFLQVSKAYKTLS